MRWFWIDRFIAFESGVQARAVKNVTLSEEHLHDHFPGFPVMPASLMLEGMAQTGGLLLAEARQFQHTVILAKVPKAIWHHWVSPGETLIYSAKLQDVRDEGGSVECLAHVGERLIAEVEIVFAHVPLEGRAAQRVDQKELAMSLNLGNLGLGLS